MTKYKEVNALKIIGARIKAQRIKLNLEIDDIAEMTGFAYNTISNIENGFETNLSYFIQICFAIDVHPKSILDMEFIIKPRFPLSASRKEKSRLTSRINNYIENGFFRVPKSTKEIVDKMSEEFNVDFKSKTISAILVRFVKGNCLQSVKKGSRNYYSTKK